MGRRHCCARVPGSPPLPQPAADPCSLPEPHLPGGSLGAGALRRARGSASGWLWGQSHAQCPEGSGTSPAARGGQPAELPLAPGRWRLGEGAGRRWNRCQGGWGEGRAQKHLAGRRCRDSSPGRKRTSHSHSRSAPERGGGERRREGEGTGSNMWSCDLSLLSLEHPEPWVRRVPHPTSAGAQCTHADVCTRSHTHTHPGDSPAAPSSSPHKLGQPLPHSRSNRCLDKRSLLSTAPAQSCWWGHPGQGSGSKPSARGPGSRLDRCPHCSGCLGGLQEAEPFVLSERNHDNHPMRTPLVRLPPRPFPPPSSGAQEKAEAT